MHPRIQNKNRFHSFNDQFDYALGHYFAKSEIIKCYIDKFFSNLLMKLITKKLSYHNTDKQMAKLIAILQGIPDNKWRKYKFQLESGVENVVRQNLTIQSQNMINYLAFFMGHLGFFQNLTYQVLRIYNQNKDQVYNEMFTGN